MNTSKTTISNCSIIKTMLMVCVVLYHSIVFWTGEWFTQNPAVQNVVLVILSRILNSFHIYGFTLVSGYVYAYNRKGKNKYGNIKQFVVTKVRRLLIPYVFIMLTWAIPFHIFFFGFDFKELLFNFLLGTAPNQLWFLLMLFNVFVLFRWIDRFQLSTWKLFLICIVSYGTYLLASFADIPNIYQILSAFNYLTYFVLGYYIYNNKNSIFDQIPPIVYLFCFAFFFGIRECIPSSNVFSKIAYYSFGYLLHISGALMAFYCINQLACIISNSFIMRLSAHTMIVYLLHQQIVYWLLWLTNGRISNAYINAIFVFICTITICLGMSSLIRRNKNIRKLFGEK